MTQRRPKGEGSLTQRSDGRWTGRFSTVVAGRKKRVQVYGRTQKEARIKLDRAKREASQGTLVIGSRPLDWWMDHWMKTIAPRRVKPQTLAGYRSKVNRYIKPHLGHWRLSQLEPEHIRIWHDILRERGGVDGKPLAEASVRQAHAILRKALTDAVRDRKLPYSPAESVDPPSTYTAERERLNLTQAQAALKAAGDNPRWWLAIFYGMRQGECLGLRWGDVDLDAGTITIAQTLQMDKGKVIFDRPKSKKSERVIPMRGEIAVRLRLAKPADADPGDLVFARDGEPVRPWVDNRAWHEFLDSAGLPWVALHSARNTAADVLEAARVPDRLVAQILGHSSVRMTHRYTHAELAQMLAGLDSAAVVLELEA